MTEPVDPTQIERIVGRARHATLHYALASSTEQRVYILHSERCMADYGRFSRAGLSECPFSRALDKGIEISEWIADVPMLVYIESGLHPWHEPTIAEAVHMAERVLRSHQQHLANKQAERPSSSPLHADNEQRRLGRGWSCSGTSDPFTGHFCQGGGFKGFTPREQHQHVQEMLARLVPEEEQS